MEYTHEYLNECFTYNKETGFLYKKSRPLSHFNNIRAMAISNRYAGNKITCVDNTGYLRVSISGKLELAHRIIFMINHGYYPVNIDHIDGNRANNLLNNLRQASMSNNAMNTMKTSRNTSGYKGVSWNNNAKKWMATISLNKKHNYLGYFHDKEVAYAAYCTAAKELHGKFCNLG